MDLRIKDLSSKSNKKIIHKNLPTIPFYSVVMGKSNSGKSNMILNLIKFLKKVIKEQNIFIFQSSPSNTFNKLKKAHKYDSLYDDDGENIVEILLNFQKSMLESKQKPPHLLLIFDDFITNNVFEKRRGIMQKLFSSARHYNISIIVTSQTYTLIPASIRRMSLYTMIYRIYNKKEYEIWLRKVNVVYQRMNSLRLMKKQRKQNIIF